MGGRHSSKSVQADEQAHELLCRRSMSVESHLMMRSGPDAGHRHLSDVGPTSFKQANRSLFLLNLSGKSLIPMQPFTVASQHDEKMSRSRF